jgi:1,4-dihydroxy-2-naphthoate octaprenyltransferase
LSKAKIWFQAARPKTLMASIGPVLIGLALAYSFNNKINIFIAIITLITALLLQVGTNYANDYIDAAKGTDNEDRLGPTRAAASGLLSIDEMKKGTLYVFIISFLFSIILMFHGGLPIVLISIFSIIAAYCYTGGPFPLSYNGLGELAALIFFGIVAVWGTFYLQIKEYNYVPVLVGLGPGFIAAAIMAINNLRDRESDRKVGKKTLAVQMGEEPGRIIVILFIFFSTFIPFITAMITGKAYTIAAGFIAYLFIMNWKKVIYDPISEDLNNCLANTGKYLLLYSIVFSIGLIK